LGRAALNHRFSARQAWARAGRILGSGPTALVAKADSKKSTGLWGSPKNKGKDAKGKVKNMSATEKLRALAPHQKATVLLLAGGIAGAVAKSCVAPLERVKLLSQVRLCVCVCVCVCVCTGGGEGRVWECGSVGVCDCP
jgi:hypothetical protein